MHVKNGCKDLKRYPQISRRVRDTLARLFFLFQSAVVESVCTHAERSGYLYRYLREGAAVFFRLGTDT